MRLDGESGSVRATGESCTPTNRLLAAQSRQLFEQSRSGLVGALVSALLLPVGLWGVVPAAHLLIWLGIYVLFQVPRHLLTVTFPRVSSSEAHAISWAKKFSALTILSAAMWGVGGVLLFPANPLGQQFLLGLFLAGIASAGSVVYSPLRGCYIPVVLVELLPFAGRCVYEADYVHVIMGGVIVVFSAVLVATGRHVHYMTADSLRLGFEKSDLIESLEEEKARAEELNENLRGEIEERERVDRALRESEERLDLALTGADLGLWDYDLRTGGAFFDRRWAEMLGYELDEIEPTVLWWKNKVHPDDLAQALKAGELHLAGLAPYYESEHRLQTKAGAWKWVLSRGKVVGRDEKGEPLRMTGTHLDINDRKEAEAKIRESLEEKEVLLREIHHRVKNNLQVVCSLLSLQSRHARDEAYQAMFKESEHRIRSMAFVHEKLYQSNNLARLEVSEYIRSLAQHVLSACEPSGLRIDLETDCEGISFGIDTAIPLGLIVTELCSNCTRHAFSESERGEIRISLHRADGNMFRLTVSDNGIGIHRDLNVDASETLGLRLVKIFVRQLQGEVEIINSHGTAVVVTFREVRLQRRISSELR